MEIKNFMLQFNLARQSNGGILVCQGLQFSDVQHVVTKEGSYTPNEDYEYLWQAIPSGESPNFIFIQTPGILNLSVYVNSYGTLVNSLQINKLGTVFLPPESHIDSVYIEGRTGQSHVPMPQGVAVSYFCFMAKANF